MTPQMLAKVASTALTRRMARGELSPATITRAAKAMEPGKFRQVQLPGLPTGASGQFNMADTVVGNFGNAAGKGYAGVAVRKVPTRYVPGGPEAYYAGMKPLVKSLNRHFAKGLAGDMRRFMAPSQLQAGPWSKQIIAPVVATNSKGLFQLPATARVWRPFQASRLLADLHEGNLGPRGQVLDVTLNPFALSRSPSEDTLASLPAAATIDAGYDRIVPTRRNDLGWGFGEPLTPPQAGQLRRYYGMRLQPAATPARGLARLVPSWLRNRPEEPRHPQDSFWAPFARRLFR